MMGIMLWGCSKKTPVHNNASMEESKSQDSTPGTPTDSVVSGFDRSVIDTRIKAHMEDIGDCYTKELQNNSQVHGRVVMRFDIDQKGNVVNLEPKGDTLNAPDFTTCLMQVFSKIQFPAGMQNDIVRSDGTKKENIEVKYPLLFTLDSD